MTDYQVEWYLKTMQRVLQRELVREANDDDLYQQASLDILRDCTRYTINNEQEFKSLFCRYFLTIRKRHLSNGWRQQRDQGAVYPLSDYCDDMGECKLHHYADDPREDPMVMAFEYIDLLPAAYRRVFVLLFVEGYAQAEASCMLNVTEGRISQMVKEGAQIIRDELAMIG